MDSIDLFLLQALNSLAGKWQLLDLIMVQFSSNHLLKGGVFMAVFWWLWFRKWEQPNESRHRLLALLTLTLVGIILVRFLAWSLPFRFRPLHHPAFSFTLPIGMHSRALDGWSSFPSDHAMLFILLAVGFWRVHRKTGIFLLIYAGVFVLLPRLYCGLHYPTDLLAGGLLGWGVAELGTRWLSRANWMRALYRLSETFPGEFYALLFLYTAELAILLKYSRRLAGAAVKLLKMLLGG
ncbi:MAG: phosphatase PAP2 family protein [Calditrichia bacterium]